MIKKLIYFNTRKLGSNKWKKSEGTGKRCIVEVQKHLFWGNLCPQILTMNGKSIDSLRNTQQQQK